MPRVNDYPLVPELDSRDVLLVERAADGTSAKVQAGSLGVDKASQFLIRDDFNPALPLGTYTDYGAPFSVHADEVSDDTGEGFGLRRLEFTTAQVIRNLGASHSGGPTDLIVRARFRIQSTIANMAFFFCGSLEVGGVGFGVCLGLTATNRVGASVASVAGGQVVEIDSSIVFAQSTWYEVECRVDFAAQTAELFVDGVLEATGVDVTDAIPEDIEDMGIGYWMQTSAGTGEVELDYIEIEGKRL